MAGSFRRTLEAWAGAGSIRGRVLLLLVSLLRFHYLGLQGAEAAQTLLTLQGKLVFKNTHVKVIWSLSVSGSTASYRLPFQPADAGRTLIPAGSTISLVCAQSDAASSVCDNIAAASITKSASSVDSSDVTMRMLVMVISLTGSCSRAGATVSSVQQAYMDTYGYADFLKRCSYGKMVMNTASLKVVNTPVPCSQAILGCNEDAISTAAKRANAGILAAFTHFSYVLPTGLVNTCGWVGLAELPGTQTWYTPDSQGVFDKGTVLQETLHNFGIYHGWKGGVEYMDYSTSMGEGSSCPSAPELWRLGWATVADTLNTVTFPAKTFRTYSLPATCVGPDKVMIKIQPDWLGGSYIKNVYLALRAKAGGDRDLGSEFDRKLNIHELSKNIDNVFRAQGDPRVTIIGTVSPNGITDLTSYKLFVRLGALTEGAAGPSVVVKVCRYLVSKNECVDTPTSSPPPPPPQVSSKPPPPPQVSPKPPPSSPPPKLSPKPPPSPPPQTASKPPPPKLSPSPKPSPSPPPKQSPKQPPPTAKPPPKNGPKSPPPYVHYFDEYPPPYPY